MAGKQLHERGALLLYEALDTPISLSCYILLKHQEYKQLVEKKVSPSTYLESQSDLLARDYQAVSYLRKFPDFDTGINREQAALDKFLAAEAICRETNRRLKARESGVFSTPDVESVLFLAQHKISHILGRWRPSILLDGGFGPGVTSSCRGSKTGLSEKFSSELDATRAALKYVKPLIGATPLWSKALENSDPFGPEFCVLPRVNVHELERIAFVPKDATVDRTIGIPSTVCMYFQKAIGNYLRSRLRRAGCDLNDQSRNQVLARNASIRRDAATIDLSSASDCIAKELVWNLLPYEWCCVMDDVRHKGASLPNGDTIFYQKWSAMGNGYTFELESLIFFALATCVCKYLGISEEDVGVYGDDIIVPVDAFDLMCRVLDYTGFVLNKDKTYSLGCFRESCGADWFNGRNVRPVFQKERIMDVGSAIRAANRVRTLIQCVARVPELGWENPNRERDLRHNHAVRKRLWRVWQLYVNHIPREKRAFIPEGYGDIGLVGNKSECRTLKVDENRGFHRYEFLALLQVGVKYRNKNDSATLIQSLMSSCGSAPFSERAQFLIDTFLIKGKKAYLDTIAPGLLQEFRDLAPTNGLSTVRRRTHSVIKRVTATSWPELEG